MTVAETRSYAGNAVETTLATGINNSTTAISIANATGWSSAGYYWIVIDPDQTLEEHIKITSRSGTSLTATARGGDGTSAVAHAVGAVVRVVATADDLQLLNNHAANSALDNHPQYVHNTVARTISAAHDFTGNPTFSGNPSFNGTSDFNGPVSFDTTPVFANMNTTADMRSIGVAAADAGTSNKPMRADARLALDLIALGRYLVPAGTYRMSASPTASPMVDELECTGAEKIRLSYPALYAAIGDTYGAGNGTTTFNLPYWNGEAISGTVGTGGTYSVGQVSGADTTTLATNQLPSHSHSFTGTAHGHTASSSPHDHGIPRAAGGTYAAAATNYVPNNSGGTDQSATFSTTVSVSVANTTAGGTVGNTGSGASVPTRTRNRAVRMFIKAY